MILVLLLVVAVCLKDVVSTAEILRPETIDGARLVGGASPSQGRLEVRANGRWGTVCALGFTAHVATLVCRGLGQPSTTAYITHALVFGQGLSSMPVWINILRCTGTETEIADCPVGPPATTSCLHSRDVGVVCHPKVQVDAVRLVGGSNSLEGRVEVSVLGQWGTVCNDYFGRQEAWVVCRQVTGQRERAFADADVVGAAVFGAGAQTAPIWLDNLACASNATDLNECDHARFGAHNCGHHEDIGVICG